jgi:hypothetical protein
MIRSIKGGFLSFISFQLISSGTKIMEGARKGGISTEETQREKILPSKRIFLARFLLKTGKHGQMGRRALKGD